MPVLLIFSVPKEATPSAGVTDVVPDSTAPAVPVPGVIATPTVPANPAAVLLNWSITVTTTVGPIVPPASALVGCVVIVRALAGPELIVKALVCTAERPVEVTCRV